MKDREIDRLKVFILAKSGTFLQDIEHGIQLGIMPSISLRD